MMKDFSANPFEMFACVWRHRSLVRRMVVREVVGRYKGSLLGLAWSFVTPFLMLAIYTFVFSFVLQARWGSAGEQSNTGFAVVMFAGMIVHGLIAETLAGAPNLIVSNANFVKKVVFPLETLPIIALAAAAFHAAVSVLILMGAYVLFKGFVHWTVLYLPLVLFPFALLVLGITWFLSSLGVFFRDIGQTVGLLTTGLLFLSPVFYPVAAVPEAIRAWMMLNPLTFIIEQSRNVLIWGFVPDWYGLAAYAIVSFGVAWAGFAWFQKTRKGFADVL